MNIISRLPRNEARAGMFGAERSSASISRLFRFVTNEEFAYIAFPTNPVCGNSPFDEWRIMAGEITDVVM